MLNTLTRQLLPLPALAFAFVLAGPSPAAAQDAARGAEVYAAQKCATVMPSPARARRRTRSTVSGPSCRQPTSSSGSSNPKGMTAKANSTKKPPMPAKYAGLPAADLDAMVAYLASLK